MNKNMHFFIIDDDVNALQQCESLFKNKGHRVSSFASSRVAFDTIQHSPDTLPDCIIANLMQSELDGIELYLAIQKLDIPTPKFIITSGKNFEFDHRQAIERGIDGYFMKPVHPDTFVEQVIEIIQFPMTAEVWGCRGTLPVPGKKSVRYGGNTNCITLKPDKNFLFIFDAGTGIKELSNYLMKENSFPISAKIFITHPHFDHINGIPFFTPLYMPGNRFDFYGSNHHEQRFDDVIARQMDSVYFPVTMKEFASHISFHAVTEGTFNIANITIKSILLNHPGRCLGYRIEYNGKSFCYITDNELYLENSPHYDENKVNQLIQFISGTDLLVIDATYSDEEYLRKIGWGHSCVSQVVDVADKAKVKVLCLHHHDPEQTDEDIDAKLKYAQSLLEARQSKTICIAPSEGTKIIV